MCATLSDFVGALLNRKMESEHVGAYRRPEVVCTQDFRKAGPGFTKRLSFSPAS